MKRSTLGMLVVALIAVAFNFLAHASDLDKTAKCLRIAEKAEFFVQEKGTDYALKVFSAIKGPFIDGELYVFCCSMNGVMLAHPYKKDWVGRNLASYTDTNGKAIFKEFSRVAEHKGSGWVDYLWKKPGEEGEFPKTTYIKRIASSDLFVGVGFYK
ncbi:MAG: cache domain-containing protein [Pseudomonadota bacterium]